MNTRQDAKRAYAMAVLAQLKGKGGVVVLPVFINEGTDAAPIWTPTDTVAIEGSNPEWCAVNVMAVQSTFSTAGFENERVMSALIRRKTIGTDDKYAPGQILNGKIAVMETLTPTDPSDHSRDIKAPSAAHAEAGIYCTVAGEPIYQRRYYTENLAQADITIAHDNQDEIAQFTASQKAAAKPQSAGIKAASAKKVTGVAGKR